MKYEDGLRSLVIVKQLVLTPYVEFLMNSCLEKFLFIVDSVLVF